MVMKIWKPEGFRYMNPGNKALFINATCQTSPNSQKHLDIFKEPIKAGASTTQNLVFLLCHYPGFFTNLIRSYARHKG